MSEAKQLWLLAGGNGSGKSTFYRTRLKPLGLPFINADIIAKTQFPDDPESHSYDAAQLAEEMRQLKEERQTEQQQRLEYRELMQDLRTDVGQMEETK